MSGQFKLTYMVDEFTDMFRMLLITNIYYYSAVMFNSKTALDYKTT